MHPEDFLTLEEWHRLLAAAPTPRDAALLWLMAGCGLRVSEAAALKIEHLDGPGGYLHVVDGKGGKQRSILLEPVLDALGAHLQGRDSGYIFEGKTKVISPQDRSSGSWTWLHRKLNLKKLRLRLASQISLQI